MKRASGWSAWLLVGMASVAGGALSGCAQGDLEAPPPMMTSCTQDADCEAGERCLISEGMCRATDVMDMGGAGVVDMPIVDMPQVTPDEGISPPEDMTPMVPDIRIPPMPDMGPEEMSVVDMAPVDMAVDPCLNVTCAAKSAECQGDFRKTYGAGVCSQGTCDYAENLEDCTAMGRVCQGGACVDPSCNPACEAPGTCTVNGCAYPACQSVGGRCDPSMTQQGDFLCLIDDQANNAAHCYDTCTQANTAQGCALGQRCYAAVQNNPSLLICLDSECANNSDCGTGTCVKFENSFGVCEPGGAVAPGGTCNPGADVWCQQGSVCSVGAGASQGVCSKVCDPWGSVSGCGTTEYCGVYTSRMGTCTTSRDASGTEAFDTCSTAGAYCDDATQCFGTYCLKYCRPGSNDCSSLGASLTCDNYVFPGERDLGICFASCTSASDCSSDPSAFDCVQGSCRQRCTTATVAADCGSSNWRCVSGYCE